MMMMVMMMMVMMIDHDDDDDDDAGYHVDYADDQEGGCSSNHLKKTSRVEPTGGASGDCSLEFGLQARLFVRSQLLISHVFFTIIEPTVYGVISYGVLWNKIS